MINTGVNNGFNIFEQDISRAVGMEEIERVLVPGFIYQRDYISNLDFSNQLNRGLMFFEYLENDSRFKRYLPGFYTEMGVDGKHELYKTLLTIFAQCEVERATELFKQILLDMNASVYQSENLRKRRLLLDQINE